MIILPAANPVGVDSDVFVLDEDHQVVDMPPLMYARLIPRDWLISSGW